MDGMVEYRDLLTPSPTVSRCMVQIPIPASVDDTFWIDSILIPGHDKMINHVPQFSWKTEE